MDKIATIKEVRDLTGLGLRESKELVETWQNGEMPERKELFDMVAERVKNRIPRSEEARNAIRNKVKGIKNLIDSIDWEDEFNEADISKIRLAMDKIADEALIIKDRLTYRLEEILYE